MHWYGLTPEWERRWRDSSSERENLREGQITSLVSLWFDCSDEDDENVVSIFALKLTKCEQNIKNNVINM